MQLDDKTKVQTCPGEPNLSDIGIVLNFFVSILSLQNGILSLAHILLIVA